jgi:hypothetical protein
MVVPRGSWGAVLSFCAYMGCLPWPSVSGYSVTYQSDITLISGMSRAAAEPARRPFRHPADWGAFSYGSRGQSAWPHGRP